MKNNILNLVFFTVIFSACVDQGGSEIDYTMFNETDKTVKVLGFNKSVVGANGVAEPIIIEPNSSYSITKVAGFENTSSQRFYSIQGIDSVRVIFNNSKVKVFSRTPPNPCSICDGNENNQHFITEQDYESAEDCNEDCE